MTDEKNDEMVEKVAEWLKYYEKGQGYMGNLLEDARSLIATCFEPVLREIRELALYDIDIPERYKYMAGSVVGNLVSQLEAGRERCDKILALCAIPDTEDEKHEQSMAELLGFKVKISDDLPDNVFCMTNETYDKAHSIRVVFSEPEKPLCDKSSDLRSCIYSQRRSSISGKNIANKYCDCIYDNDYFCRDKRLPDTESEKPKDEPFDISSIPNWDKLDNNQKAFLQKHCGSIDLGRDFDIQDVIRRRNDEPEKREPEPILSYTDKSNIATIEDITVLDKRLTQLGEWHQKLFERVKVLEAEPEPLVAKNATPESEGELRELRDMKLRNTIREAIRKEYCYTDMFTWMDRTVESIMAIIKEQKAVKPE